MKSFCKTLFPMALSLILLNCGNNEKDTRTLGKYNEFSVITANTKAQNFVSLEDSLGGGVAAYFSLGGNLDKMDAFNIKKGSNLEKYTNPDSLRMVLKTIK